MTEGEMAPVQEERSELDRLKEDSRFGERREPTAAEIDLFVAYKDRIVGREKIDGAIFGNNLNLFAFVVTPFADFNCFHCAVRPFGDGSVKSPNGVNHVDVAAGKKSGNRKKEEKFFHFIIFLLFTITL